MSQFKWKVFFLNETLIFLNFLSITFSCHPFLSVLLHAKKKTHVRYVSENRLIPRRHLAKFHFKSTRAYNATRILEAWLSLEQNFRSPYANRFLMISIKYWIFRYVGCFILSRFYPHVIQASVEDVKMLINFSLPQKTLRTLPVSLFLPHQP